MNSEKTFRTKTGYCHILPDIIVLTRDGILGNVAQVTAGKSVPRLLIIYGLMSLALIYWAIQRFQRQQTISAVLFSLFAAYLIYGILTSLNNSAASVIERGSIQYVKFIKGISGVTRARIEVYFIDENGKTKKRLIFLPGVLSGGPKEVDIAYNILLEEKLLVN